MSAVAEFLRPENWRPGGSGPRYIQLRQRLEAAIASGLLPPDAPLPPEREIAQVTELSRVTVRKAIQALAEQGAVVQRQGSGSFVAPKALRVEQSLSHLTSFTEDMARRGYQTEAVWLERGIFLAAPEEIAALHIGEGGEVARIGRLRTADGRPMAVERASLPLDILPNPMAVGGSLYRALADVGHRPVRAVQKISAVNLDATDAALLKVAPSAAGLKIERVSHLADDRIVEFTRSIYRGDAYDFVAQLRLSAE